MAAPIDDELTKLLAAVGWSASPLRKWRAKLEILLGLSGVAAGLLRGMSVAVAQDRRDWFQLGDWLTPAALIVLGGYLALAGHRSHLYQSNNRLAAYLSLRLREPRDPHEHSG